MTAAHLETVPSGKKIGMIGFGDPLSRRLVLFCHPLHGSAEFDPDPHLTQQWGLRLLSVDRPGYGSSEPWAENEQPGAHAWAADIAGWLTRVIDEGDAHSALDYHTQVGIVGWGVGGVYALAAAQELGDRVDRLALVEAPSPRRRRAFATGRAVDIDESSLPGGDLGRRLSRMLDAGRGRGSAGAIADRAAVGSFVWDRAVTGTSASTLLVYRPDRPTGRSSRDASWYGRRLASTSTGIVRGDGVVISRAWERVLAHVAPQHGDISTQQR